jgi:hypothetical protein
VRPNPRARRTSEWVRDLRRVSPKLETHVLRLNCRFNLLHDSNLNGRTAYGHPLSSSLARPAGGSVVVLSRRMVRYGRVLLKPPPSRTDPAAAPAVERGTWNPNKLFNKQAPQNSKLIKDKKTWLWLWAVGNRGLLLIKQRPRGTPIQGGPLPCSLAVPRWRFFCVFAWGLLHKQGRRKELARSCRCGGDGPTHTPTTRRHPAKPTLPFCGYATSTRTSRGGPQQHCRSSSALFYKTFSHVT